MDKKENVVACYDKVAKVYYEKCKDALVHKRLDRMLLREFAHENRIKGQVLDLGCGPGHTTRFLHTIGLTNIKGIDISVQMIQIARHQNPGISFEQGDMLALQYEDRSVGAAIAYYSIVHFNYNAARQAFHEVYRVLDCGGDFLLSFHIGDDIIHLDQFLNEEVDIDFYLFRIEKIRDLLLEAGFKVIDLIRRYPYASEIKIERAYIWASVPAK